MRPADALAFVNEAIDAISNEGWSIDRAGGELTPLPVIQCTIANDLKRINLGLNSPTIASLITSIEQAAIALHGAKQALENK